MPMVKDGSNSGTADPKPGQQKVKGIDQQFTIRNLTSHSTTNQGSDEDHKIRTQQG